MELKINKEFKDLVSPLTKDEFERLQKSIIDEGCRDPLIISDGEIIDGHNRYKICKDNNKSFKTKEKKFKDNNEKKIWIINNQLARRNLSNYDRTRLALKQEDIFKEQSNKNLKLSLGKSKKGIVKGGLNSAHLKKEQTELKTTDKRKERPRDKVAKVAKVGHDTVAKVKVIEREADDETKKKLSEQKITINKVYKDIIKARKREAIGKNGKDVPLPERKYSIIYADPPWNFKHYSDKGRDRSPANYYRLQSIEDLKKLKIKKLADDNCVLFVWVTHPFLEKALDVIRAWGFKYKTTGFTWVKKNKKSDSWFWGMGYWTRANSELCLIATKGSPQRKSSSVHSLICTKIEEHSKKPDIVKDKIVELMGDIPRIELFARTKTKGWDVWGDEVND